MVAMMAPPVPKVRCTNDYVLLQVIEPGETAAGIALPDGVTGDGYLRGKVVKVGPGKWSADGARRCPPDVQKNDVVFLVASESEHIPCHEITLNGVSYIVVKEIYCRLVED